jgi:hypothetical protein
MPSHPPHFLCAARLRVLLDVAKSFKVLNPKLLRIAAAALALKPVRMWESFRFKWRDAAFQLHPQPVFIIGYWQSGHSLLHNLLACDPQFSTVRLRHASMPSAFKTLGPLMSRWLEPSLPRDRGVDSLPGGLESLQGDDFLLAGLTKLSSYYAYVFPKAAKRILEQALFFSGASSGQIAAWQHIYKAALHRVAAEQGKSRVLSRNAANTTRIPQLLQMFPGAKFIHVHRDPYEVFAVQHRRLQSLTKNWSLQDVPLEDFRENTLHTYEAMIRRYLQDKSMVRSDCLAEVRYDDVVNAPVSTARRIYDELSLGDFEQVRPRFETYAGLDNGSLLEHVELSGSDKQAVATRWQFAFEAFGYPGSDDIRSVA